MALGLVLTALVALGAAASAPAQVSTPVPGPTPVPVVVNLPAGDDGWTTLNDGRTALRYDLHPIPRDFFGLGSDPMGSLVTLFGNPIANSGGLAWNTDTVVRRLADTGLLSVGSCALIPIEFLALHLESNPFTVSYGGVPSETWKIVGGLSTAAAQPIGRMQICRTCGTGGTFGANLRGLFLLRFIRTSPPPVIEMQLDCGVGDCPETVFQTTGAPWALSSSLTGAGFNFDPLPPGLALDMDTDGSPDAAVTIGKTNFQGGIKICGTGGGGGGGGGGGAPECAVVDHVANDSGDKNHEKSSHGNYAASTGDHNGDGLPDHCCPDEDGDGHNDVTGEPCEPPVEEEPTDRTDVAG